FDALAARPQATVLAAVAERNLATETSSLGDNERAQRLADDAVQRARAAPDAQPNDLGWALYTAGWVARKRGDTARAKALGAETMALAESAPVDDQLRLIALLQRATADKMGHDIDAAIAGYSRALEVAKRVDDDQFTINTEQLLGAALYNRAR